MEKMDSCLPAEDLKKKNDELISQLQTNLSQLKAVALKYSTKTGKSVRNKSPKHATQYSVNNDRGAIKNIKSNIQLRRSARSTSTPKVKKIAAEKERSLIADDLSLLMLDDGNVRPAKSGNLVRKSTSTPIRSSRKISQQSPGDFAQSSKAYRTPIKNKANKSFDKTPCETRSSKYSKSPKITGNLKLKRSQKSPKKSILQNNKDTKTPSKGNRVWFSSSVENESTLNIEKTTIDTTMMGYDWIASMLDNETSLNDRSDSFFNDLREFRKENWNDCKGIKYSDSNVVTCDTGVSISPPVKYSEEERYPLCCEGNGAYMVNKRLDLVPIHGPYSACPSCKSKPMSQCDENGFVRVTIPRSTVKSPYKLRSHRRKSYDPSDSVALSMHCLAGWQAAKPACICGPSNIDLASYTAKPGLRTVKSVKEEKGRKFRS